MVIAAGTVVVVRIVVRLVELCILLVSEESKVRRAITASVARLVMISTEVITYVFEEVSVCFFVDVFKRVVIWCVVLDFVRPVRSTIVKTLEMMVVFAESMMMISTSLTVIMLSGVHLNEPVLLTESAISEMIVVVSLAPAGTR